MLCVLVMAGCSSSTNTTPSKSTPPTVTGVFIDGPTNGVRYIFGRYSGLTDSGGSFACQPGETGQFKIGNLLVGQAPCASVITPVDLVRQANPQLTISQAQTAALPLVQFMLSVGTVTGDGSITVSGAVSAQATSQSAELLSSSDVNLLLLARALTNNQSLSLVDSATASKHLATSLANIDQAKHAGEYVSSSLQNDIVANFLVKPNGDLSGYLLVTFGYIYEMMGSISPSGTLTLSIKDPGTQQPIMTHTGVSSGSGTLTWTTYNGADPIKLMVNRVTPTTNKYVGMYKLSLINFNDFPPGECWFVIDANGKLYGFEDGTMLGSSTYGLSLSGEINRDTGAFMLKSVAGSSDTISMSGVINGDGSINSGTWKGMLLSGTFFGAKLPLP